MGSIQGQTVIVTGAAGGLGAAVAAGMAELGAKIVLVDRDEEGLAERAAEIDARDGSCDIVVGDITDPATTLHAARVAKERFGPVTALCNIAGISPPHGLGETTPAIFDHVMHTNCLSQLLGVQAVAPQMIAAGGGSIVNVSSVGALVALPRLAAYCASKAAVLGLTRSVAYEYAEQNIRCNAICPGGIDTPMAAKVVGSFPNREEALSLLTGRQLFKRFATPEEIASMVIYLAGPDASFVNGAVISVDAGHTTW